MTAVMTTALWQHQVEAVEFILRWKKAAAWHDTGTGKTRTGIEVADRIGASFILVLCPPIAVEMWKANFEEHGKLRRVVTIVRSPDAPLHSCNVVIVPFSLISKYPKLAKRLRQYQFDLILIDEAHALKSMDSARTRSIYAIGSETGGLQECTPYVALLSATLLPNGHPNEAYPHLKALRPELLGPAQGYDTFVARYCEVKFSRGIERIVGAKKDAGLDLTRRLSTFVHRVKKKDVQKNLPPFTIDVWPVAIADLTIPETLKREWEVTESLLARDIGRSTGEEALAIARGSPHSATQRRLTGLIKLEAMYAVLAPELEAGRKVISFSYHRDVIAAIEKRFAARGVVTLDGSTSPAKRIATVKAFREDPRVHLFNGQIAAAGEVIDLTPCSLMWIFEQDWVPKTITQAIGRANRPGQIEPLTVWILALAGSIDEALSRTLARKTRDIAMLEPV
jgi:SWI/SNF-related matrix-associated actin-dependent regulator 1 of chromatin subfamily A